MATSIIKQQNMKLDLLWTNPNPRNNLTGQTINVDCSQYQLFIVETYWTTNNTGRNFSLVMKSSLTNINVAYNRNYFRSIRIENNDIIISDCDAISTYNNATTTTANGNLIVYRVYGVK